MRFVFNQIKKPLICLILLLSLQVADAQQRKSITIEELFTNLVTQVNEDSTYVLENVEIIYDKNDDFSPFNFLKNKFPENILEDGRFVIDQELVLFRCLLTDYFLLDSLHFKKGLAIAFSELGDMENGYVKLENIKSDVRTLIYHNDLVELNVNNSHFNEHVNISFNVMEQINVAGNKFKNLLSITSNENTEGIWIENNDFDVENRLKILFDRNHHSEFISSTALKVYAENIDYLYVEENTFKGINENNLVQLGGSANELGVIYNDFTGILSISMTINRDLEITGNKMNMLNISDIGFSGANDWISFGDSPPELIYTNTLGIFTLEKDWLITDEELQVDSTYDNVIVPEQQAFDIYYTRKPEDIINEDYYKRIVKSYYQLESIFEANGDLDNSNFWYARMKEAEAIWLKHQMNNGGSLNITFRYYLNRLMRVYTMHGTDPGRAVVMSIWIMGIFALFYLFFPSEWDRESKSKLIKDFRTFVQKNEKGYLKPLTHVIKGFTISIINAFTLSLNSFVTLGFGRIPTSGIARYICIFQGFIGWFLLSLFTVALINQVLF